MVAAFIDGYNKELGRSVEGVDPEASELLEAYPWPGNVRELRNVIERAVLLSEGPILTPDLLPPEVRRGGSESGSWVGSFELGPDGIDLEELERRLLEEALRQAEGNRTRAGLLLGLSRHQIRNRLHKYGMADS